MALEKVVPAQPPATARMASLSISLLSSRSFIWMLAIGFCPGLSINMGYEHMGGGFSRKVVSVRISIDASHHFFVQDHF